MAIFILPFREFPSLISSSTFWHSGQTSVRLYGSRKGIQQLKRKNKQTKKEEVKKKWVPPSLLKKEAEKLAAKTDAFEEEEEVLRPSVDDVWVTTWHEEKIYTIPEAIAMHREANHPSIYNKMDAFVEMKLDLNMTMTKKTKFLDDFKKIISLPFPFNHQEVRVVAALAKNKESQEIAKKCGADFVGGFEIIKMIQKGELKAFDVDAFISHPDIILDMLPVRGILRQKFPNKHRDTLGENFEAMINLYKLGCEYQSAREDDSQAKSKLTVKVGRLNMETGHLESNIETIIKAVCKHRSLTLGRFINKAHLIALPNNEIIPVIIDHLLPEVIDKKDEEKDVLEAIN